jgi:hypothetical protein
MITQVPQGIKGIPDPAFCNKIKYLVVFRPEFGVCHDDHMFVENEQFKMYAKSTLSLYGEIIWGKHWGPLLMKRIKFTKYGIKINCIFNDITNFLFKYFPISTTNCL